MQSIKPPRFMENEQCGKQKHSKRKRFCSWVLIKVRCSVLLLNRKSPQLFLMSQFKYLEQMVSKNDISLWRSSVICGPDSIPLSFFTKTVFLLSPLILEQKTSSAPQAEDILHLKVKVKNLGVFCDLISLSLHWYLRRFFSVFFSNGGSEWTMRHPHSNFVHTDYLIKL